MNKLFKHSLKTLEFSEIRNMLLKFADSTSGKKLVTQFLPLTDSKEIKNLITETSEIKNQLDKNRKLSLAGIIDIDKEIESIDELRSPLEPSQLIDISSTLEVSETTKSFFDYAKESATLLWSVVEKIDDFKIIINEINRCIDSEKKVRDSASSKLKKLRHESKNLNADIQRKLQNILRNKDIQQVIENENITSRNGRPVIAIKSSERGKLHGTLLDKSNTGLTAFIEPSAVSELVNNLEDIKYEEAKEISRILWELTRQVAEKKEEIILTLKILAHIDLTNAKARFSLKYNMVPAKFSEKTEVELVNARHPLLANYTDETIPINLRLGSDFDLLIITGPNTGGKTVTLKTLGLFALMNQSGMHIPADWGTKLPVFNNIFADIGDEQSLEQSLSTFSAHITNIAKILNSADENSLVLLDELGSGTDPTEGAALGTAILDHLRERKVKAVATTHLGELKMYAYTWPGAENASVEFDRKTFKPTYRLLIGQPGSSNAITISKRLGMPKSVLENAKKIMSSQDADTTDLINQVQSTKTAAERARRKTERLKIKLKSKIKENENEKLEAVEKSNALIKHTMDDIKKVIENYVFSTKNAPNPWGDKAVLLKERIQKIISGTPLEETNAKFIESIKEGEAVYVVPFNSYGTVKIIKRKQKNFQIEIKGSMYEIPFELVSEKPFTTPDKRIIPKKKVIEKKIEKAEKPPEIKFSEKQLSNFVKKLKPEDMVYIKSFKNSAKIISISKNNVTVNLKGLEITLSADKISPLRKK